MGSRPCPGLVEWVLPQKPQGWPVTVRTASCLFSDSVAKSRRKHKHDYRQEMLASKQTCGEEMNHLTRRTTKLSQTIIYNRPQGALSL